MTRLILTVIVLLAATASEGQYGLANFVGRGGWELDRSGLRGTPQLLHAPATVDSTALDYGVSLTTATIRGAASWYCGGGSACTRGHSPSDLIAAIDPTTGIEKGERVTVWHGSRRVVVEIVDVCACPGARIIDLSRVAFSRLADPSVGLIRVTLVPARGSQDAQPRVTLPPTDTEGGTE